MALHVPPIADLMKLSLHAHVLVNAALRRGSMPKQGSAGVCGTRAHTGGTPQDKGRKSINIVTEKVSFQGVTRFEDRRRLPLGVATNFSAYAAKVLTQVPGACPCVPPKTRAPSLRRRSLAHCRVCCAPVLSCYTGSCFAPCTGAALTAGFACKTHPCVPPSAQCVLAVSCTAKAPARSSETQALRCHMTVLCHNNG